jgi:hypothetical protein
MTIANCFQKCGFNLSQTNNGEGATDLSIAEDDWGQLKAGVSFQEHVSCDDYVVTREVQTLEQMMDEKFASDVSQEEEGRRMMVVEKVNLQQYFCQHWRALTL